MPDKQLVERLRVDLHQSLNAELVVEGVLCREDVERSAQCWLVIAEWNYPL